MALGCFAWFPSYSFTLPLLNASQDEWKDAMGWVRSCLHIVLFALLDQLGVLVEPLGALQPLYLPAGSVPGQEIKLEHRDIMDTDLNRTCPSSFPGYSHGPVDGVMRRTFRLVKFVVQGCLVSRSK